VPTPPITLVVASRDRRERLLETLVRLVETDPGIPVVVVDDGSTDGTAAAIAERFPAVRVLAASPPGGRPAGAAAARNAGVRAATTPLVALGDDDAWWAPGALARAVERFDRDPGLGLLAAHVLVGTPPRPDEATTAMARGPASLAAPADHDVLGFVACGVVARRAALLAVGGFPARYGTGGEEAALAIELAAAGWGVRHAPDVVVHHEPPGDRDPAAVGRRRATMVRNDLWTAWARRRGRAAVGLTAATAARAAVDADARRGLRAALREAPRVLAGRRAVRPALERRLRTAGR